MKTQTCFAGGLPDICDLGVRAAGQESCRFDISSVIPQ
jgi:hypothetical protein